MYKLEDDIVRKVKNMWYVLKCKFLVAVVRPRYCPHRKCCWDGKIGTWPIVRKVPATKKI